MTVFFEKIQDISGQVNFFSPRIRGNELTEFQLFDNCDFPHHHEELQIIYNVIDEMRWRGAKHYFFKFEESAHALPRVNQEIIEANTIDFGLRLYCIRLTDNVVVLLNGGIKTKRNPRDCPNVKSHFLNALKIATKLDKMLNNGDINYQDKDCLLDHEFEI